MKDPEVKVCGGFCVCVFGWFSLSGWFLLAKNMGEPQRGSICTVPSLCVWLRNVYNIQIPQIS